MDRLAFGTDNGQVYIVSALKLISKLFLEDDQSKDDFGIENSKIKTNENLIFFRCSIIRWSYSNDNLSNSSS